jgi:hypothetical protein
MPRLNRGSNQDVAARIHLLFTVLASRDANIKQLKAAFNEAATKPTMTPADLKKYYNDVKEGYGAQELDSRENEGEYLDSVEIKPTAKCSKQSFRWRRAGLRAREDLPETQRAMRRHTSSELQELPQVAEPGSGCAIEAVFVVKSAKDRR